MKLSATTRLRAGELQVEREGIELNTRPVGRIEKSGTQHCVRSSNPNDPNFGCWPSKEEAQEHVRELDAVSQYGRTGWPFGRGIAHQVGYISRRETTGYQTGGRGHGARMATPKGPTHKPNPSVGRGTAIGVKRPAVSLRRPKLETAAKVLPLKRLIQEDVRRPAVRIEHRRLDGYGTSEGVKKEWDTRGRGHKFDSHDVGLQDNNVRQWVVREVTKEPTLEDVKQFLSTQTRKWATKAQLAGLHQSALMAWKWKQEKEPAGTHPVTKDFHPVKRVVGDLTPEQIKRFQEVSRMKGFADYGEPMAGAMGHAHIEPVTWFHPPSLTKRVLNEETRVPGDDPREKNDKFLDVTKRKEAYEQRMKLLKRSGPSGAVPVRTTLLAPHSGVYQPLYSSALKAKRMKGRGRMFTSYERRGVL